jgi:hypothetical protein
MVKTRLYGEEGINKKTAQTVLFKCPKRNIEIIASIYAVYNRRNMAAFTRDRQTIDHRKLAYKK